MGNIPSLTILCPTRGRPENALRLLKAFKETTTADSRLVFIVDADDPKHDWYYWHLTQAGGEAITWVGGETGMAEALNHGFFNTEIGYAVGFFGDDVLPKTVGWDTILLKNLREMKTGLVYGDDLLQGERIATHPVMTKDFVDTLGWMAHPGLKHLCIDVVLMRLAQEAEMIRYVPEVVLEHLHPANGKAPSDEGYTRVNSEGMQEDDGTTMRDYLMSGSFEDTVAALRALKTPPKKAPVKRAPRKKVTG